MMPADHRCTVCEELFTRDLRPAGEIHFNGDWGDACPTCYHYYQDQQDTEDDSERVGLAIGWGVAAIIAAATLYFLSR